MEKDGHLSSDWEALLASCPPDQQHKLHRMRSNSDRDHQSELEHDIAHLGTSFSIHIPWNHNYRLSK